MRNLIIGLVGGVLLVGTLVPLIAQRSADSYPDAPTADPKHYSVSFENDVARFIRVRYGPGEKSPMHRHLPGCVRSWLASLARRPNQSLKPTLAWCCSASFLA